MISKKVYCGKEQRATLTRKLRAWRVETSGRVLFTNGCFDPLRAKHVRFFELAIERCKGQTPTCLIVAVNDDASEARLKGPGRPFLALRERMEVLAGLECVDYVIDFTENTPTEIIREIRPNVLIKGGDYTATQVAGHTLVDGVLIIPTEAAWSRPSRPLSMEELLVDSISRALRGMRDQGALYGKKEE